MLQNLFAFLPLTCLIGMALLSKNIARSMVAAVALGLFLLHRGNMLQGTVASFYTVLSDSSFQFCLMLILLFGGIIELFQQSGALQGFGNFICRFARGKRQVLLLAWLMSVLLFVDEYLNATTVSFSMKEITDRNQIPREHLAFQAHAMACCLCATIPFTSWIGFSLNLVKDYGMAFPDYVKAIPLMLYPLLLMLCALLLALGFLPKVGQLKTSYQRVEAGGPTEPDEISERLVEMSDSSHVKASSAFHAILPIAALVAGTMLCGNDLIPGLLLALACQFLMYTLGKLMTVTQFFEHFFNGAKGMTVMGIIVFLGFVLSRTNESLGFFDLVVGGIGSQFPAFLLPAVAFLLVGFCVFAVGGCWVVMLITMPVFAPLAVASGASVPLTVAAVMSGICLGYSLCFYADALFVCSAGTGVSNLSIIKTTLPYAALLALISCLGFVVLGLIL